MQTNHQLITKKRSLLFAAGMLLASASPIAYAEQLAAADQTAQAAQSAAAGNGGIEEIVVTARKVRENLQQTPITVTAVSGQQLEDLDIGRPEELAAITPGFHYEQTGARFFNKPTIRGLTVNSIEYNNQKTNVFIDGIVVAGSSGSLPFDDGEIAQVEVLKGPQSTAFGRGTLGGGVNYTTKDPGDIFEGEASAEYRTNNETHDYAFISGPIIPGILKGYIDLNYYSYGGPSGTQGGFVWKDITSGAQIGSEGSEDIAAKFVFTPTDWLTTKLRVMYGFDDDGIPSFDFLGVNQRNLGVVQPNGSVLYIPGGAIPVTNAPIASGTDEMTNPGLRRETWRINFNADADLGFATLSSVTAYNHEDDAIQYGAEAAGSNWGCYLSPFLGCPYFGAEVPASVAFDGNQGSQIERYEDFQQEFRLTSKSDGPLKWMVGADYFNWWWLEDYAAFDFGNVYRVESVSGFGSASYDVTDQITLGVEGRYNWDHNSEIGLGYPSASDKSNTYRFLPRFTADYKFTPDIMFYGVVSEGNHPANFFGPGTAQQLGLNDHVAEEILWNYEAGVKADFLDHHLRVDVSGYHMEWTNQQLLTSVFYTNFAGVTETTNGLVNAGKSHIDGVELEVTAKPIQGLNLRGTLAYDNAVYDKFCSYSYYLVTGVQDSPGSQCRSAAGKTLAQQPPLTMSFIANWEAPLYGDTDYFVTGEWEYRDKKYGDETNLDWTPVSNILNFRAGINNEAWRIEAFVDNATQENAPTRVSLRSTGDYQLVGGYGPNFTPVPGAAGGDLNADEVPQKPRQFGIKVTYHFGGEESPAAYTPPPLPPTPAPMPAPAPAPVAAKPEAARSFQVFFDFDKSDITAAAAQVIQAAADAVKAGNVVQITVTGHTDTVGSAAYNQALSERRAAAVKATMVADGVGAGEITTIGVGKTGLLVPTGDGVREPQNRRAEIVLK